jgi:hypothetical protein
LSEHYIVIGLLLDEPVKRCFNNLDYFEYKINGYRAIGIKTRYTVDINKDEYIQLRDSGALIELDDNLLNHNEVVEINGKVSFPHVRNGKLSYLRIVDGVVHKDTSIKNIELIRQDIEELEVELYLMYDLWEDKLKLTIAGSDIPCISIDYLSGEYTVNENGYSSHMSTSLGISYDVKLDFQLTSLFDRYLLFDNGYAYINKICLLGSTFNGDAIISNECDTLVIGVFNLYNNKGLGNIVVPPSINKVYKHIYHSTKKYSNTTGLDSLNLFLSKDLSSKVINDICRSMFTALDSESDLSDNEYYLKNFNVSLY